MPINTALLAVAAGIISAVVFASATTGAVVLRVLLFFMTPLSLYLAGLGLGPRAAALAAVTAVVIIILLATPAGAVVYAVSTAVPAVIITRLAMLSRGESAEQEWYPVGRLVVAAAIFGGVFTVLALLLLGGHSDELGKTMRGLVETFVKSELPTLPGGTPLTPAQIDEISATTLKTLPWALGMLTMITILLNLWLAGRITLASGRLVRPWPQLRTVALPSALIWALLAAIALTFATGSIGLFAGGFAGALTTAFALVGLAVVHVFTAASPWRNFLLAFLYAGLAVATAGVGLVLACVGIAETIFHYRSDHTGTPPERPS